MTDLNDLVHIDYYGDNHAIDEDIVGALEEEELREEQDTQGERLFWKCSSGVFNVKSSRI